MIAEIHNQRGIGAALRAGDGANVRISSTKNESFESEYVDTVVACDDVAGIVRRKSSLSGLAIVCYHLPLILHIRSRLSLRSYSKGARGLTIYILVLRIFTANSISLGPCPRDRDSGAIVTPFVQAVTYATRNFTTLGQLELLPPFTGASIQSL
ncbi:hypothetical protein E3N88_00686 [Mikania micrantha]|uniref:Uncharacterized protein n=1 Tax=Mikania micrantha TaxID=192012 RepID=A0A5N6Q1I1_9ASTR|nr:hypothetical protein E3N88_00686 [Mikania micrantha]